MTTGESFHRQVKRPNVKLITYLYLLPSLRMRGAKPPLHLHGVHSGNITCTSPLMMAVPSVWTLHSSWGWNIVTKWL